MKITKRKCKGVLADMVADMDEDSLAKTREQMVGMSYRNTDIVACGHATCPSRESCLRWVIGRRMDDYQSFGSFQPRGGKCKFYRWTQERADDAVLSNLANTGKNFKDNGNKEN